MRRHLVSVSAFCVSALLLAGCAGRPNDLMLPVTAKVEGATTVPLLVATTRQRLPEDPGRLFSGERARRTRYARIDVSIPPVHKPGEIEFPDSSPGDPARHFVVSKVEPFGVADLRTRLREAIRAGKERQVLLFVHGYNTRFDDAVFRFAQLANDTGMQAIPILFTWPSRGRLLAYPHDRESATYSRDALETLLNDLADEPMVGGITVLAHSMGNWVTLEALRQQAIRRGRVASKIGDVMLAAPDVDVDVARTQIEDLGRDRPRITLFVAQDDRALAASKLFWNSSSQLGSINPKVEPYRTDLEKAGVQVVDLTGGPSGDPLRHNSFARSPKAVGLIAGRLSAGQQIVSRETSFGQVVGSAVAGTTRLLGETVSTAVTAPLAIVDPGAREDLGDRLQSALPGGQTNAGAVIDEPEEKTPRTRGRRRP